MKAIARGRLRNSLSWKGGAARIADPQLADREWASNTDLSRAPDAVKDKAQSPKPKPPVVDEADPQPHGGWLKRTRATDGAGEELPFIETGDDPTTLAEASAREKHWRAELAALKYKQAAGELVSADEIRGLLVDEFTRIRTQLMGVPSKIKTRLPHLALQDLTVVDELLREVLEELSNPIAEAAA